MLPFNLQAVSGHVPALGPCGPWGGWERRREDGREMGRTGEKWKGRDRSGKDGREVGEDRRDVGEDLGWGGGSWRKALPAPSPVVPGLWNPREQARSVLLNKLEDGSSLLTH